MTSQDLANELLQCWQALWALSPPERIKRIDQLAAELAKHNEELALVAREMEIAA